MEAAFDEIVGVDGDEFEGGFVPEARDEKIEDLFATLVRFFVMLAPSLFYPLPQSEQARQMEKAAKVSTIHDFDNALDKMTRDPGQDDMADALAQLDSIKL